MPSVSLSRVFLILILSCYAIAADDIRLVDVFSVDEAGAAVEIRYLLRQGLDVGLSFKYGSLFYYVPYVLMAPLTDPSDRTIVIVLRAVCACFGIGCLFLTYRLGCVCVGNVAGLIGTALLALTAIFLRWGVTIHPDLPQLFWILLTLLMVCRLGQRFSLLDVAGAAVLAALAFNTKYGGLFLLPIIGLATLLAPTNIGPCGWLSTGAIRIGSRALP